MTTNFLRWLGIVVGVATSATALADCGADPNNLVTNCGFNTDATDWSVAQGSCGQTGADGFSLAGRYECNSASDKKVLTVHFVLQNGSRKQRVKKRKSP